MPFERIGRIVGGADNLYIIMLHQSTRSELGVGSDELVALVVDGASIGWIQGLGDAESSLELQVSPMIERVTESVGNCLCPLLELLPVGGILAGAETLVNAIAAHGTPLVVIAHEPDLCDRLETLVFGYHLGNEVTVIIDDRHFSRMLVVKLLCSFGLQQEVLIQKCFHCKKVFIVFV